MSDDQPRVKFSPAVRAQLDRQKCADQFDSTRDVMGPLVTDAYRSMIDRFNEHFEYGYDIVDIRTEGPVGDSYRIVMEAEARPRDTDA